MYLTQSSFFGKTGPINPSRQITANPPPTEKDYPNKWMEERNLRQLHKKNNSLMGQNMFASFHDKNI